MAKNSAKRKTEIAELKTADSSRTLTATVISDKMNKTARVQVMRMVKHPMYGKYLRRYSTMFVHDEQNAKEGDVVKIKQTRPLSKLKCWVLVEIIRRAELGLEGSGNELEETGKLAEGEQI